LKDSVVLNVDADEFRAAGGGEDLGSVFEEGTACVEEPEAVVRVQDYALYADKVVLIVGSCWRRS
jgi:hypothetical protein